MIGNFNFYMNKLEHTYQLYVRDIQSKVGCRYIYVFFCCLKQNNLVELYNECKDYFNNDINYDIKRNLTQRD